MKIPSTLLATALVFLTSATSVLRAELNSGLVPADSKWVAYADLEALRETELGKLLLARLPVSMDLGGEIGRVGPDLDQVMSTIGSITAFGDNLSGKQEEMNGAMIIEGTSELRKIAEGLVAHMTLTYPDKFEELTELPYEAHRIHREIVIGFPTEPIIVVSRSPAKVTEALAMYRGRGDSISSGDHALSTLLPKKSNYYLFGASLVPSVHTAGSDNSPQARILQMTQAAAVCVSEESDLASVQATLVASDSDLADKLIKIIDGLTAILALAESDDADLETLLNSLKAERNGRQVTAELSYSTERLVALVEQHVIEEANRGSAHTDNRRVASARKLHVEGDEFATWMADADLGGDAPTDSNTATFTSEPVELEIGTRVILTSARHGGEHARVDYFELIPVADAGAEQRHEAEYLRLNNYRIEKSRHASGTEFVRIENGHGTVQLRFAGPAGSYRVRVGYVDENDGAATFHLSTVAPQS